MHRLIPLRTPVYVIVAPHRVATGLGVHGIVFAVAPAAGSPPGHLHVSVDYSQFADAYGGGFASRLHLVELPACAMATPQVPSCGKGSHLSCAIDVVKGLGVSFMTLYALMGTATGRAQIGFAVFVATHNGGIGAHPTGGAAVPLLRLFGACVGGQSFTAATQVRLANGDARPISDLKPGDKVLAIDTKTGKTQAETVTAVMVHRDTDRYDLTIRTRTRAAVIHTTRSHLFWDADTRHWVIAAALRRGTHLLVAGGSTAVVAGGGVSRQAAGWMWDLTVLPSHDFYILADKTPVLVHNAGGPPYNCTPLGPPDPEKRGRLTNSQARDLAEYLGFRVITERSHGQIVFTDGKWFITQDIDSHNHGTWKIARSKKDLATKDTREATTDALLNIIGEL